MKVQKLNNVKIPDLVKLHYECLPHEFLTSISSNFLQGFYANLLSSRNAIYLGVLEKNLLIGALVCLTKDYKPLIYNYLSFFMLICANFFSLLFQPQKIFFFWQSFYFKKKFPQETEIFFIGVRKKYQNKGIGKLLLIELSNLLKPQYQTITVDCKQKLPANNFYKHNGFKAVKNFNLYYEKWTRYKKSL